MTDEDKMAFLTKYVEFERLVRQGKAETEGEFMRLSLDSMYATDWEGSEVIAQAIHRREMVITAERAES